MTLSPAVIRTVCEYSTCRLILDSFLSRITSWPSIVFLRGCRSFTSRKLRVCLETLMFLAAIWSSLCFSCSMYRFVPPLVVLAQHDSKLCSCLLSSLFTVLRVLYAIVRLSSVQISDRGFFSVSQHSFCRRACFRSIAKIFPNFQSRWIRLIVSIPVSLFDDARQHNKRYLFLALRDILRKNMTNHKVRKKLANQKWIHGSAYPCGISEQAFWEPFRRRT